MAGSRAAAAAVGAAWGSWRRAALVRAAAPPLRVARLSKRHLAHTPRAANIAAWHADDSGVPESTQDFSHIHPQLKSEMQAMAARIHQPFKDETLLMQALTADTSLLADNSRLVVLGESILRFAVAEFLYVHYPNLMHGELRDVQAGLLLEPNLADIGHAFGLEHALYHQGWALGGNSKEKPSLLMRGCAFKALVGAMHLDQGSTAARQFARNTVVPSLKDVDLAQLIKLNHPKAMLTRILARLGEPAPVTRVIDTSGHNTHFPTYVVGVFSGDKMLAQDAGTSINRAEKAALRMTLVDHFSEALRGEPMPSDDDHYVPETDLKLLERVTGGAAPAL